MRTRAFCVLILGILNDPTIATTVKQSGGFDAHAFEIIHAYIGDTIDVSLKRTYPWCYIRTPDGVTIDGDNVKISGVRLHSQYESCVARITVTENTIGQWTLMNRKSHNGYVYEMTRPFQIVVEKSTPQVPRVLYLVDQSAVNMEVGPENAVYCRLENPNGVVFFDGFGRCKLNLDRVNALHNGQWWMMVGLPEKVRVEMFLLQIEVVQKELKSQVQMSVAMSKDDPSLTVSCSVETSSAPRVCKFRDPQGQILIAQEGVGEGRYTFQGTGVSTNGTDKHVMDCGLRISSPTTDDLGIWRCAIETESDVYYGFHLVICPWLVVSGSLPPSVVTEPTLASRTTVLSAMAGDDTQMMCTIPAGIRYCYFRSNNGTVFTVLPSESNAGFDYVGNGFEAGECGIRLKHISVSDFGRWTCHVGVTVDGVLTELSTFIMVSVQELFVANLFRSTNGELGVFAMVNAGAADLEYCRFVRGDGRGFTNEVLPYGYEFNDVLHQQRCELRILRPTAVDFQSWTVAVKIRGQQNELLVNTRDLINTCSSSYSTFFVIRLTLLCICMALLCLSLGLLFSSEEKRRWTYVRITAVRDSVRRSFSFRKPPPVVPPADTNATTSQAA